MIAENIQRIGERISASCLSIKRNPAEIILVCVAKGRSIAEIKEALSLGVKDIGENKIQEALLKYNLMRQEAGDRLKWHMIGHLQRNKVKDAVKLFDLIHSVDSLLLAQEIDQEAGKIGKLQDILLEVKTSPEATKSGFVPQELGRAVELISGLTNLKVKGLMTIAPLGAPLEQVAESARPYFRKLRQLRDDLDKKWLLSMGMSDDFEVAIEEGADLIRLGRAIFSRQ